MNLDQKPTGRKPSALGSDCFVWPACRPGENLALIFPPPLAFAARPADELLDIRGVVVDTKDPPTPLVGVTVLVQGTVRGTTTDAEGFSLDQGQTRRRAHLFVYRVHGQRVSGEQKRGQPFDRNGGGTDQYRPGRGDGYDFAAAQAYRRFGRRGGALQFRKQAHHPSVAGLAGRNDGYPGDSEFGPSGR